MNLNVILQAFQTIQRTLTVPGRFWSLKKEVSNMERWTVVTLNDQVRMVENVHGTFMFQKRMNYYKWNLGFNLSYYASTFMQILPKHQGEEEEKNTRSPFSFVLEIKMTWKRKIM